MVTFRGAMHIKPDASNPAIHNTSTQRNTIIAVFFVDIRYHF